MLSIINIAICLFSAKYPLLIFKLLEIFTSTLLKNCVKYHVSSNFTQFLSNGFMMLVKLLFSLIYLCIKY